MEKDFEVYYLNKTRGLKMEPHSHDYYEFYFFVCGVLSISVGQSSYDLHPGDLVCILPGIPHRITFADPDIPCERFLIHIDAKYFDSLVSRTKEYGYIVRGAAGSRFYVYSFDPVVFGGFQKKLIQILEEQNSERYGKQEQIALCLNDLLLNINRCIYDCNLPDKQTSRHSLVHELTAYIDKHLSDELTLDSLSKRFYVNKYYISHYFKDTLGIPFKQYLTGKRLEQIRAAILKNEDISNTYVNYGFKDYSSLFRAFKKEYGMSPREYQKKYSIRRNV